MWPAVTYKELTWSAPAEWQPRAGEYRPRNYSYQSAIPPRIASLTPEPHSETLERAIAASAELNHFDAAHGQRIANFAPILLRSEAASSSQIEHLTANARNIMAAEIDMTDRQNAREIAGNTAAMRTALDLAHDPSAASIRAMHQALLGRTLPSAGQWRDEAVWIGTSNRSPISADFVAPPHGEVPELIDDLVLFMTRRDILPLVSVAISHAQFETIHPFIDGNGRTGRALAQSLLRFHGVTRNVAIPVSAGLLAHIDYYHHALTQYRRGIIDDIIIAFSDAALRSVANARTLIVDLDSVGAQWEEKLRDQRVRKSSGAWVAITHILRQPVFTTASLSDVMGIETTNLYRVLNKLSELRIIVKHNVYRRGAYWSAPDALRAIDAFAERAGRREIAH